MTEEEGDRWIALALLHGPTTMNDNNCDEPGSHDPLHRSHKSRPWWVFRNGICVEDFATRAEAARHYCKHYGIEP